MLLDSAWRKIREFLLINDLFCGEQTVLLYTDACQSVNEFWIDVSSFKKYAAWNLTLSYTKEKEKKKLWRVGKQNGISIFF